MVIYNDTSVDLLYEKEKLTIITQGSDGGDDDRIRNGAINLPTGKNRLLFLAGPWGQDRWAGIASSSPSWPSKVLRLVTLFTLHFFHTDNNDNEEPEAMDADVESVVTFPAIGADSDSGGQWA